MTQTMRPRELAGWLNSAADYMAALASYPVESAGDAYAAEVTENSALYEAALALQAAATQLTHLRANGVQTEIIVVNTRGGAK
jgi:hypothetical protein